MRKIFYLMAMAIVVAAFAACSNSEDSTSETPETHDTQDVFEKNSEAGAAVCRLMSMLTAADSLPDNWKDATFEVDYGKILDEATPTVRSVVVDNVEHAAKVYSMLIGKSISSTATTDTWTMEGVGSLVWNAVNQAGLFATVDVDIKFFPDLTQIRFVPAAAMGENTGFTGVPYYYIGDVVKDKDGVNWICVQPANSYDDQSYWAAYANPYLQINPAFKSGKHYKFYDGNEKKGFWYQLLPHNLGTHNSIFNYIVLMKTIAHYVYDPENTHNWSAHNNDATYSQFYCNLNTAYEKANIWNSLFPLARKV